MQRHHVERGEAERFIEQLLGLRLDREHYERGEAFCRGVIERAGMEGLNRLWESRAMLPTPNELDAPGLWLARIDLPDLDGSPAALPRSHPRVRRPCATRVLRTMCIRYSGWYFDTGASPGVSARRRLAAARGLHGNPGPRPGFFSFPGPSRHRKEARCRPNRPYADDRSRSPPTRSSAGTRPPARTLVRVGEHFVGAGTFTLVAGPCAVETPEQLAAACEAAVAAGATMLRGDLYKHRTSPYSFQGLGADGVAMVAEQRSDPGTTSSTA